MDLFWANYPLIYYVFEKKYLSISKALCNKPDLIQSGRIGLWKACKTFNEEKGIKFSTYAVKCISNEMANLIRKHKKFLNEIPLQNDFADEFNIYNEVDLNILLENKELLLKILKGMTLRGIAKEKGVSCSSVCALANQEKEILIKEFYG